MEYTAVIFVRTYNTERVSVSWQNRGTLSVSANSLEDAIRAIQEKGKLKFPSSVVHIDWISDSNQKELYKTAWDEEGTPLVSFINES